MSSVSQYRKKPVVIDAIQWTGDNLFDVITFTDGEPDLKCPVTSEKWEDYKSFVKHFGFQIKTLEGMMSADKGDYIIKGVKGEFYPCKPDIFAATYEAV